MALEKMKEDVREMYEEYILQREEQLFKEMGSKQLIVLEDDIVVRIRKTSNMLYGITESGMPIWERREAGYPQEWYSFTEDWKKQYTSLNFEETVLKLTETDKNMTIATLANWQRWRKKRRETQLAFCYKGILWCAREKESMEEAAERFFMKNSSILEFVEAKCEKNSIAEKIFEDGGVFFRGNNIVMQKNNYKDLNACMWFLMACEGFFEDMEYAIYTESFEGLLKI